MSTNDKATISGVSDKTGVSGGTACSDVSEKKINRKVSFPNDEHLVTQYFEPSNPWQDGKPNFHTFGTKSNNLEGFLTVLNMLANK
ncbi:jg17849 [Pararge aegeria aegeria]|uniref:Jg17849 protein n=1 Tax=Pararge aegeria aegeria TaxID=348720 RepID=A0A8S4R3X7_9NEOP|nr:jg17849 [Pararge aegeria aegeria]